MSKEFCFNADTDFLLCKQSTANGGECVISVDECSLPCCYLRPTISLPGPLFKFPNGHQFLSQVHLTGQNL